MYTLGTNGLVSANGDFLFGRDDDCFKTVLFLLGEMDVGRAYFRTLSMR